jgi:hypothetical protein
MADTRCNIRVYLQPAFLICVVVLAIAAGATMKLKVIQKVFLPLKKSFDALDESKLAPYKVVEKLKIENEEVLKALETQDYIQWILEDTEAPADSAVKKCVLFVTYYGKPDRVPHVPEECYTGGGFQILKPDTGGRFGCQMGQLAPDNVTFRIKKAGFEREIDGQCIVFGSKKSNFLQRVERFPVLYFFNISGEYAGSRNKARIALNKNLFQKYSYFSKVELVFNQMPAMPSREEAVIAGEKLLSVVLPILEQEHWPDWPVLSEPVQNIVKAVKEKKGDSGE